MAKKTFNLDNPAMQFISTPAEAAEATETAVNAPEAAAANETPITKENALNVLQQNIKAARELGLHVELKEEERRNKHIQLLVTPSTFDILKAVAWAQHRSVNDLINKYIAAGLEEDK